MERVIGLGGIFFKSRKPRKTQGVVQKASWNDSGRIWIRRIRVEQSKY